MLLQLLDVPEGLPEGDLETERQEAEGNVTADMILAGEITGRISKQIMKHHEESFVDAFFPIQEKLTRYHNLTWSYLWEVPVETATLSSKGQIVIPKPIRDAHGWRPGIRLVVEDSADGILIRPAHSFPETELSEGLGCTGYKGPAIVIEKMKSGIDQVFRKDWSERKKS